MSDKAIDTILIDGDEVAFRLAFSAQVEGKLRPKGHVLKALENFDRGMRKRFVGANPVYFIGGKGNFRYDRATLLPYKGDRANAIRPFYLKLMKQTMLNEHYSIQEDGYEADDALAMRHWEAWTTGSLNTALVCQDKDLNQIPGWRYNAWTREERYITANEARRFVFKQWLVGDKQVDNIPGVCGIGAIKADKLLKDLTCKKEMANIVARKYVEEFVNMPAKSHLVGKGLSPLECMQEVGALIWMLRHKAQDFDLDVWSEIHNVIDEEVVDENRKYETQRDLCRRPQAEGTEDAAVDQVEAD